VLRLEVLRGALASFVRPLPKADGIRAGRWHSIRLDHDALLILDVGEAVGGEIVEMAVAGIDTLSGTISRSRAGKYRATLAASATHAGLDIETLDRIALNATPGDTWLASIERAMVETASNPVLELACHWVLKEAFGKALGVGLALPLEALMFCGGVGGIVLEGAAAPTPDENWQFKLYRHDDVVFGMAYRLDLR
jgi:hypothetical protein